MNPAPKPEQTEQWAKAFAQNPDNTGLNPDEYPELCLSDRERVLRALVAEQARLGLYDDYNKPTRSNSETQQANS